ncbi:hypothetical protein [Cyclobacterium salsum]|nr:hypothetical protein [Cyclobacterium salsum]
MVSETAMEEYQLTISHLSTGVLIQKEPGVGLLKIARNGDSVS